MFNAGRYKNTAVIPNIILVYFPVSRTYKKSLPFPNQEYYNIFPKISMLPTPAIYQN